MGCGTIKKTSDSLLYNQKTLSFENRDDRDPETTKEINVQNCPYKIAIDYLDGIPSNFTNRSLFTVREEQSYLEDSAFASENLHMPRHVSHRWLKFQLNN